MSKEIITEYGKIEITEEVLATIAGAAAVECYGIVGMASKRLKDGIVELLGRENLSRGVKVVIKENEIQINLNIIVGYGVRISEVAANVRDKVKYTVESMSGLPVSKVNVHVRGVKVAPVK
jgi:uncharacterized alkaline shock family protein YloU